MSIAPTEQPRQFDHESILRTCHECKFSVNRCEWKLCRKVDCPIHFEGLDSADDPRSPVGNDITLETKRKFLVGKGTACPFCDTPGIGSIEQPKTVSVDKLTRKMECDNGHIWHEVFLLTGVLSDPQFQRLHPNTKP